MSEKKNERVTFSISASYHELMVSKTAVGVARANLVSILRAGLLALDALPEAEQRRYIERGVKEVDLAD